MHSTRIYSSATCKNARNTMLGEGEEHIRRVLLERTLYMVEHSGSNGCKHRQSLNGGHSPASGMVTGGVSMSKACSYSYLSRYGRVPTHVQARIDGDCWGTDYSCTPAKHVYPPFVARYFNEVMNVHCRVNLSFYG